MKSIKEIATVIALMHDILLKLEGDVIPTDSTAERPIKLNRAGCDPFSRDRVYG